MAILSACATGDRLPVDYIGRIKTQTAAPVMAACIGQFVAVEPVPSKDGLVIDVPNAQPRRRYTVAETEVETVVTIQGGYARDEAADAAAVKCAMSVH